MSERTKFAENLVERAARLMMDLDPMKSAIQVCMQHLEDAYWLGRQHEAAAKGPRPSDRLFPPPASKAVEP